MIMQEAFSHRVTPTNAGEKEIMKLTFFPL